MTRAVIESRPAGRRRGQTRRGKLSRDRVLSAAVALLSEEGYRGASLASIAAAADLTQQGVLHYFPSKEALLLSLLEEKYHEDGRRLSNSLDHEGLGILRALESLVAHNTARPDMVKLFSALVAESLSLRHPAHHYFVRRYRKVRERMLRSLRVGQRSGEIRDDVDLDRLVPAIVAVMDGLQIQWLLEPEVDMAASFGLFVELLERALCRTGADAVPSHPEVDGERP